ncbi:MAG: ABC transporter ATP-binding protein/permease [Eubacterium sp.]|nr:ABC transporter ATP-binding protein/permease [Eubacterium sp.]
MAGPGRRTPRGMKPTVENPGKILKRLMGYVFEYYGFRMIMVFILIIISVLANLQGTLFMKTLIDDYIDPMVKHNDQNFVPLIHAILKTAAFYLIGIAATYSYNRIMVNVSQGTLRRVRDNLFEHMQSLPIKYFDTHTHGDIMSIYTNDVDTLRQMISQSIPSLFQSGLTVIGVIICMLIRSVPLTIVSFIMVGFMLSFTMRLSKKSGEFFVKQQKNLGKENGFIEEMITGQKVVKVFCHEKESIEEFDKLNEALFDSSYNANKYANILMPSMAQLGNLSYVICIVVGAILILSGFGIKSIPESGVASVLLGGLAPLTVGGLVSFLTFNKSFNMPINQVSMQFNAIIMALAGADRVFKLLDEEPEADDGYVMLVRAKVDENGELTETKERTGIWAWKHQHQADGSITYQRLEGAIFMDDVDFGYVEGKTVLHNVSLDAKPGQKVAFVGSTGAGKTTITNLINRFYDIQDGKIRFDNINVNKIKKGDLRRSLGLVLQDTHLFTATVMENIRYGRLDATDEECIAAAKLANADHFIRQLPDGYNTMLTGDGGNLSQGQRQLLSIARAAVADPPALILDEATSSIDTRTEREVQEGMDKLMAGRTTFVIAHRLSTVKNSDCIMVLEQGRVIEKGTHEELLEQKGKYFQLYTGMTA